MRRDMRKNDTVGEKKDIGDTADRKCALVKRGVLLFN